MTQSLRIAITNPDLVWARGAQRQAIMLAREWRAAGHEVAFFVGEKRSPYPFDELLDGISVHATGPWNRDLGRTNKLPGSGWLRARVAEKGVRATARALAEWHPDIVNAHNHPAQWGAGMLSGVPHVWTCNEPPLWHYYPSTTQRLRDPWMQAKDARLSRSVRAITVLDTRIEALVRKGYPGIPVHCTGSGCELPGPLPPRGAKAPAGAPEIVRPGFHVLSVLGELNSQKRALDAVLAAGRAQVARTTLHLVGADTHGRLAGLHEAAARANIVLHHTPMLSEEQLLYYYANADAALFLPENQPWGIFPLEALLAGVPAVCSNETGSLEVLPTDYPYVAPVGDIGAAGARLAQIAAAPTEARAAVKASAEIVRRDYTWRACADRLLSVMQGVIR